MTTTPSSRILKRRTRSAVQGGCVDVLSREELRTAMGGSRRRERRGMTHSRCDRAADRAVDDYEVEVTMPDGRRVDVQLEDRFVVGGANPR